jgi:hypothetical protein
VPGEDMAGLCISPASVSWRSAFQGAKEMIFFILFVLLRLSSFLTVSWLL